MASTARTAHAYHAAVLLNPFPHYVKFCLLFSGYCSNVLAARMSYRLAPATYPFLHRGTAANLLIAFCYSKVAKDPAANNEKGFGSCTGRVPFHVSVFHPRHPCGVTDRSSYSVYVLEASSSNRLTYFLPPLVSSPFVTISVEWRRALSAGPPKQAGRHSL